MTEPTHPTPGFRHARTDEIGLYGINSQDKIKGDSQSILSTRAGRIAFYAGMTFSIGSISIIGGSFLIDCLKRIGHKGRSL